jgi:membrane associated rhomboid family serine protease
MAPRTPVTLQLPAFRGAVRQLVLALVGVFFVLELLQLFAPTLDRMVRIQLMLEPDLVVQHFYVWQVLTHAFYNTGILGTAFALLTLWFTGSMLEDSRGSRWFIELFYLSVVGGGVLATLLAALPLLTHGHIALPHVDPSQAVAGVNAPLFGVLVAFALLFGDVEFLLLFIVRVKAKYMVVLGGLLYVATLLRESNSLGALLALCCGLMGYLYVKMARRTGLATIASERYFGMRNNYYRWKRRRAARKFQVYMRKQDRVVKFDDDGRYIAPDDERHPEAKKDHTKRTWMN